MTEKEQTAQVLKWVNKQRTLRELPRLRKIPKGTQGRTDTCPIAKALSTKEEQVFAASWGWCKPDSTTWHKVPDYVADFMRRFDTGKGFQEFIDAS